MKRSLLLSKVERRCAQAEARTIPYRREQAARLGERDIRPLLKAEALLEQRRLEKELGEVYA